MNAGGTATHVTLKQGGALVTSTAATVLGSNRLGNFAVENGKADGVVLESGGRLDVLEGHSAWKTLVDDGGNRAEMSPEAAGIAACLMTYSHHACRTECYAMTVHYYRLRDYALQHPECSAIMHIID
ncbi:antirestriction protein [Escherichia coli]|uniref:antirestriction protein n=1 Tax=Escherichia coli TaxID=562 RepID=UPI003965D25E